MMTALRLQARHWEAMRAHVAACSPFEGCGLLVGTGEQVSHVQPIANALQSRTHFRMDGMAQLRAFREIEERDLMLLGVFHSHPAGDGDERASRPSDTDVREAAYPVVHIIWCPRVGEWQARGFWIESGRITDVSLLVSPNE
jgi:proteasome lid subunit RPN8/RPN11